jgi:uncharacterized 2Fe-2S/4Fe-4S cluster protein (DUF4445 family)
VKRWCERSIEPADRDFFPPTSAKAALYAGARLLMDKLKVTQVDRIKLAGAFGSHIDPKYAMTIGLIPDCGRGGYAAGTSARMTLLSRKHRREVEELVRTSRRSRRRRSRVFKNTSSTPRVYRTGSSRSRTCLRR